MKKLSVGAVLGLMLIMQFGVLNSSVAQAATVRQRGTDAVPISRVPPRYPANAANAWTEGWVLLSFVIDVDGSTKDIEILDSSIEKFFDRASVSAVKRWTYKPATLDGKPVRQAKTQIRMTYIFNDSKGGVSRQFKKLYGKALKRIQEKNLEEARKIMNRLEGRKQKVLAEIGYLDMLEGYYWLEEGDESRALSFFCRSLIVADQFPNARTYSTLLKQLIHLSARQNQLYEALNYYQSLVEEDGELPLEDPTRDLAERIQVYLDSPEPFATQGKIYAPCNSCQEDSPLWRHSLYRNKFTIDQVEGNLIEFKLLCGYQYVTIAFDADMMWNIEDDWGQCDIHVYGDVGTTFRLVELHGADKD